MWAGFPAGLWRASGRARLSLSKEGRKEGRGGGGSRSPGEEGERDRARDRCGPGRTGKRSEEKNRVAKKCRDGLQRASIDSPLFKKGAGLAADPLGMENEPFELTREHESSENEPNSRNSTQTQQTSNGLQETIEDCVNGAELESCPRESLFLDPEAQDCNNRLLDGMDFSRTSSNAAFLGGRREIEQCRHRKEKWKILRFIQKHPRFVLLVFVIVSILIIAFGVIGFFLGKWTESAAPWYCVSCPEWWVGYKEKCYYFSETEGTWNSSQRNCSSHGASLASIDSQQEMDFLKHFKGHKRFWIGLQREAVGEPWKWTNGSIFNDWFNVAADGLCAYLDDDVSSTFCDSQRYWICSKSF